MEIKTLEQYAVMRIDQLESENDSLQKELDYVKSEFARLSEKYEDLKKVLNRVGNCRYNAIYGEPTISFETVTYKYDPKEYAVLSSIIARSDEAKNDKKPEAETSEA